MRTVTQIKAALEMLSASWRLVQDPRVVEVLDKIRKENALEVAALKAELEAARSERKPTLRWPENTPKEVLDLVKDYWSGTTESYVFRIHMWNDSAVWTSYPAGGYSTVGGFTPTPPSYCLISRTERERANRMSGRPKRLKEICFERNSGKRVTPKMMKDALDDLSNK